MLVYNYDENGIYTGSEDAFLDPEASKQQGERVYFLPANATFEAPPTEVNKIAKRENNTWILINDFRGQYYVDSDMNPQKVTEAGDLPEGCALITQEQIELLNEKGKNYYLIDNGELILNPNYEKEEEEKEKQRIAMLHMTKYDFYKYICQPNNITYPQLVQLVNSNENTAAAWNLCAYVYRGDELLIAAIKMYLPSMTDEQLTEIFEEYGE